MTNAAPVIKSFSQSTRDERCLEVWFDKEVTDASRSWLLEAINEKALEEGMKELCGSCKWWDKVGSPPPVHHRCFRYPPVRLFDGEEAETQWPWTAPTDYCGEFAPDERGP